MKKIILVFIISFILAIGIFLGVQYYINIHSEKGALQVTSSPESKVYINDGYIGQTPLCKCQATDMIAPGDYTIRVVPVGSTLQPFQEKVTISQGVLTVVDRKFGTNGQSEGSIISLTPLDDKTMSQLVVVSFPQGAKVTLDDQDIGTTPFSTNNPTESDHDLKVSKDGYNEKEIRIRTPLGYKLTVAAYLSTNLTGLSVPTASAPTTGPTATPGNPTPTPEQQVLILQTPTGYLHVREGPTLAASEVGQVTPGKTYPLISEQSGWDEIMLPDGTTGWISAEYVQEE
jgi:hypothetical protein